MTMQERREEEPDRRRDFPRLAPRSSRSSAPRERNSTSSGPKTARLSHRSRAGCWTCRGRKVKCDEKHPRCGPCTRLDRECDWEHRWKFDDATESTQGKYSNVKTTGNAVWDRSARPSPISSPTSSGYDDLPEFKALSTDEERERKAESKRPGTYSVVVTPHSFYDLPEYAEFAPVAQIQGSRRTGTPSSRGGHGSPKSGLSRSSTRTDPNTVVLDRFEDPSATVPVPFSTSGDYDRRGSLPDLAALRTTSPPSASSVLTASGASITSLSVSDDHLFRHFRQYIVPRLIQPQQVSILNAATQGLTLSVFEQEAARFPALYHAICALSALNLSYNGRSTLEEALQHYHQAVASPAGATSPTDLTSDGVFLRHFILFLYDICIPMVLDEGSTNMWTLNLNHLERMAVSRHHTLAGPGPYGFVLWSICELDVYACLLGRGNCDFTQAIMDNGMIPSLDQQVPALSDARSPGSGSLLPSETQTFLPILDLRQGVVMRAAKLAQTAQLFRSEAAAQNPPTPGMYAKWQATASHLQHEFVNFWTHAYPEYLAPDPIHTRGLLPERAFAVLQNAVLLYHACIIYLRTSMFPGQRRIPIAGQQEVLADTEQRVATILTCATNQANAQLWDRRQTVFPVFMAGFATFQHESKNTAIRLILAFEPYGLGQNTYRTRELLEAVCSEQRQLVESGRRMEDAEWMSIARDTDFSVVNCGL